MSQAIMVVDCGSFATAAAVVVDGQVVPVADSVAGTSRWRTSVFVDGERLYAGGAAELRRHQAPDRYSDGLRQALDTGQPVVFGAGQADAAEVLFGYLSTVLAGATTKIDRLALTVPPGCNYRGTLLSVAARLGFPDAELVSEAIAVADEGLVCDLGVNWSVSLVHRGKVVGHEISGGRQNVDRLLLAELRAAPDEVRALKMRLIDHNVDEVVDGPLRLTRAMLDRCAEPALRWLIASCRAVVARAGVPLPEVATVTLVGGGVLPQTARWLHEGLGVGVHQPPSPELAVIRGAARLAAGVSARRVRAEPPAWRVEPLTWDVPDGRLLRWLVAEGEPFAQGALLAQVRTADDRVFDLTAARAGLLTEHRIRAGGTVGNGDIAALSRASTKNSDGLERRHHIAANGDWILTPDRRLLVECDGDGVRVRTIGEAAVVHELRLPQPGQGNVFFTPSGAMAFVAWDKSGNFNVWDVSAGRLLCTFSESGPPLNVLVNETDWRLLAESGAGVQVGRYRRSVAHVWDLGTGARIERLVGDDWRRRRPGYTGRTRGDGFAAETTSPDGRLRASTLQTTANSAAVVVREVRTDREVFRADGVATEVRAAFSADGQHLLANWRQTGTSWADIWQL